MTTQQLGVLVTAVLGLLGLMVPLLRALFDREFANTRRRLELLKMRHEIEALKAQHKVPDAEVEGFLPARYQRAGADEQSIPELPPLASERTAPIPVGHPSRKGELFAAYLGGLCLVIASYPVAAYESIFSGFSGHVELVGFLVRSFIMPFVSVMWVWFNRRPRRSLVDAMQDGLLPPAVLLLLINANVAATPSVHPG